MSVRFIRWIVVLMLSLPGFAQAADYSAGFSRIQVRAAATDQAFPLVMIYSTQAPSEMTRLGPFSLDIAMGAELAEGVFPLVVISHGSGGSQLGYRSIAMDLAHRGFVVALPLHPGNHFQDNSAVGSVANWTNRPIHLTATIDTLLSAPRFATHIDAERIAVVGHSAGGYTALAVAGAVADTGQIHWLCQQPSGAQGPFCSVKTGPAEKPTVIQHKKDERVKALVLMAPVGVLYNHDQALSRVQLPVMLLQAEHDEELIEPYHADVIAQRLPDGASLARQTIKNAGHYAFITPFPGFLKAELGPVAEDPAGFDRAEFHRQLGGRIAEYLHAVL